MLDFEDAVVDNTHRKVNLTVDEETQGHEVLSLAEHQMVDVRYPSRTSR